MDLGAAPVGLARELERLDRDAVAEFHVVRLAVAPDAQLQPFGEGVHDRDPDAVQAARNLVRVLVELAAACNSVITISAAERLRSSSSLMSVGMPRPLSTTEMELSVWITTLMSSQCPARASSIALSTTSNTMWCRPVPSEVSPMYMPGRLRTASRPFRILMLEES